MPTYEYRCRECGERLEAVQAFSDAPLTECPACGGPLRKLFNSVGISFKGSGFYRNDSRSGASSTSSSDKTSTEKSTAGTTASSGSSSSDKTSSGAKESSTSSAAASA